RMNDDPLQELCAPARPRPFACERPAVRTHRAGWMSPAAAIRAVLVAQLAAPRRRPVRDPILAARAADELFLGHGQSPRSSSAPVGTMLPLVTSDSRAPGTWFTDVPRICRAASMMRLMPWTYASDRLPPLVFVGRRPPTSSA